MARVTAGKQINLRFRCRWVADGSSYNIEADVDCAVSLSVGFTASIPVTMYNKLTSLMFQLTSNQSKNQERGNKVLI